MNAVVPDANLFAQVGPGAGNATFELSLRIAEYLPRFQDKKNVLGILQYIVHIIHLLKFR